MLITLVLSQCRVMVPWAWAIPKSYNYFIQIKKLSAIAASGPVTIYSASTVDKNIESLLFAHPSYQICADIETITWSASSMINISKPICIGITSKIHIFISRVPNTIVGNTIDVLNDTLHSTQVGFFLVSLKPNKDNYTKKKCQVCLQQVRINYLSCSYKVFD